MSARWTVTLRRGAFSTAYMEGVQLFLPDMRPIVIKEYIALLASIQLLRMATMNIHEIVRARRRYLNRFCQPYYCFSSCRFDVALNANEYKM